MIGLTLIDDSTPVSFRSAGATFQSNFPLTLIEDPGRFRAVRESKPRNDTKKNGRNALKTSSYTEESKDEP